jgi:hypothetical protein
MSRKSTKYEEELRYVMETMARWIESQPPTKRAQWIDALLDRLDPNEVEARLQARRAQAQG